VPEIQPSTRTRWLIALPLVALLVWLVITLWHWGSADLRIRWARETMDNWTTAPALEDWQNVRGVLVGARDARPDLPDAHEQLARLYALRAGDRDDARAMVMLREARASYEQALRLRPASPYTWSGLAYVTHRDEAAFAKAFERADTLGPWEGQVQLTLMQVGLQRWERLDGDLRERTRMAARRALGMMHPREVAKAARSVAGLERLCSELGRPAALGRNCPAPPEPAAQN
jgi:hypothetical protein